MTNDVVKNIIGPGIVVYKNAFPRTMNLVERYESSIGTAWSKAGTNEDVSSQGASRFCEDFRYTNEYIPQGAKDLDELIDLYDEVMNKFKDCLLDYGKDYHVKVDFFEILNIIKYSTNNFFNYHSDDSSDVRYTVSCLGYFNDDYEGGNLHFKFFDINYSPEIGDLIVFPSAYIYAHAAYPIKKGTKYVAALMTDRTQKGHRSDQYK